jgi:preprotein translocase subunit SecA
VDAALGEGRTHPSDWNLRGLADEMSLLLMTIVDENTLLADSPNELRDKALAIAEAAYRSREREFTPEVTRELERHLYLYTTDEKWREHLHELDHLKGGIGLRAYGQRDPLVEYKKEAFLLFETMMNDTREEFVKRFFRVQLAPQAAQQVLAEEPRAPRRMVAQHAEAEAFGGAPAENGEAAPAPAPGPGPQPTLRSVDPQRSRPQVGRNDPCWCGSGKKYKKCHQPIDEGTAVS